MNKYIYFFMLINICQLNCLGQTAQSSCNEIKIIPISINNEDLEEWHVVDFQFLSDTKDGILLIPREVLSQCVNVKEIKLNEAMALCLRKEFFYTHSQDSIGIRLYGRFDVEITEIGKPFIFPREVPVYKCNIDDSRVR